MNIHRLLDAIAEWLLIILIGLLPFFFVPLPWLSILQPKVFLAAIILAVVAIVWYIARALEGSVRIPWTPIFAAVVLLPIAYLASAAVHGFSAVSLVGTGVEIDTLAVISLASAALVITALVFASSPHRALYAIAALLIGGFALAAIELVHLAFPSLSLGGALAGLPANLFGGLHEFAMMLGLFAFLGLAFGTALSHSLSDAPYVKYVLNAVGVLSLVALAFIYFMDVWVMLALALCAVMVIHGYRQPSLRSIAFVTQQKVLAAAFIVSVLLAIFGGSLVNALPDRVRIDHLEVRPSWQGTYSIARESLTTPLSIAVGSGPNTFGRAWGLHKPVDVNLTPFWNATFPVGVATIPTSLITVGVLGFLAWLAFAGTLLYLVVRTWITKSSMAAEAIIVPLSIAVSYLLLLHVVSIPGSVVTIMTFLLAGVLIALLSDSIVHLKRFAIGMNGWVAQTHLIGGGILVLLIVVVCGGVLRTLAAETYINRAIVTYATTGNIEAASQHVASALAVYSNNDRAHRAAVQLGLIQLQALVQSGESEAARQQLQETLERTIQHGLRAVSINATAYQNWLELAALYGQLAGANVEGAYEEARAAYQRAANENPTSPLPTLNLARLEMLRNNPQGALEHLALSIQLKQDFAPAYYLASQVYASQNDFPNALAAAVSTAQIASSDPEAWFNLGAIAYTAGEYQASAQAMQQALAIQPQFANAMYILGLAYEQLGGTSEAIAVFEALDALDPGQEIVQTTLSRLRDKAANEEIGESL